MLVAAAFVPSAPVLVPEVASSAAHELDDLREACDAALAELLDAEPDLLVVVGAAPTAGPYPAQSRGTFAPWGVDLVVGRGDSPPVLPLSLTVGTWLLERESWEGEVLAFGVASDESPERARALGAGLCERAERVAVLVVGDGSARRTEKAPGSFDPRAADFDAHLDEALADSSGGLLASLDVALAQALMAEGRAAWQVAAGMAQASPHALTGHLLRTEEPYGVHYAVATWTLADSSAV